MTAPVLGEPAWLPDPTGRHQHRWFDGRSFTDRVADEGITSIDPGPMVAGPPLEQPGSVVDAPTPSGWAPPGPATPAWGPTWPAVATSTPVPGPAATPPATRRSRLPLLLALAGTVLVLAGGIVVVLSRGGDAGAGTFEGTIDDSQALGTHEISLEAGDVLLVTLLPGDDLDAVLGLLVDDEGADALEDTYGDTLALDRQSGDEGLGVDIDDAGDRDQLLLRTDLGFGGEAEELLIAVADDVDLTVVVAPFEPGLDEDDYEISLEVVALDVDDRADGEELLEAVEDDDDVPAAFQDLAGELLETG